MTDTTAPDAITQADRLKRVLSKIDAIPADYPDDRAEFVSLGGLRALAAASRLAAHGAGEGLRGIADRIRAQATCLEGYAEQNGYSGKAPASVFHWQATHFRDLAAEIDRALPTPTDAGSTTREGGEGLRPDIGDDPLKGPRPDDRHEAAYEAVRAAYVQQQPGVPDQTALVWRWHLGALLERHVRLRAILARDATTSSPDASPDSGEGRKALEAAREALLREAVHMEQDFPGDVPEDCGWWCRLCRDHVDGDRSTGPSAEGHKPDCPISKINAALHPSPEAPANRQEAGE